MVSNGEFDRGSEHPGLNKEFEGIVDIHGIITPFRPQSYSPWCCSDVDKIKVVEAWIMINCFHTKTIVKKLPGSYGYKHIAQHDLREYISNGHFIAAAIRQGVAVKPKDKINAWLGLKVSRYWTAWRRENSLAVVI